VAQGEHSREIRLAVGEGLAGAVARTGHALNIPDAYSDPRFDRTWDDVTGYRTRNVLCVPMKNRLGRPLGVVQVLNRLHGPFTPDDEAMASALAAQAAVTIENNKFFVATIQKNMELLETKQQLEKKAAGQKNQGEKAEQSPAEKSRTEQHDKKKVSSKKGEDAAKANEEKQDKVKAAKVPDKESVKAAKEKTDEAEKAKEEETIEEVKADKKEEEEEKDESAKPSAASLAKVKGKAKPDAAAAQLKVVKANLGKAYQEQQALTRQLISILNGLAGLETNLEKRRKLQAEAKGKLPEQLHKLDHKVADLKHA
jgi:signal transduction protein with GAF and PtsI domain